jgi:hypothetical protein
MIFWSGELKELEKFYSDFKDHLPYIVKELEQLIKTQDPNVVMLYSRRCLEVIITDLCERELNRPRKTEPLKGIIDKLNSEEKVPSHIISSMLSLNSLATYGTHPKDFDPEQVKPVLNNLAIVIKWYLKYKDFIIVSNSKSEQYNIEVIRSTDTSENSVWARNWKRILFILLTTGIILAAIMTLYFSYKPQNTSVTLTENKTSINVNSGFANLNDSLKSRFIRDGYFYSEVDPDYFIEFLSEPDGDPVATDGSANGFKYYYLPAEIKIRINAGPEVGIGISVPQTLPGESFAEARQKFRQNFTFCFQSKLDEIYSKIKKYVPQN